MNTIMASNETEQLYRLFDDLNRIHFDGVLPQIPLRFTGRLRTTGGQYMRKPIRAIQISRRYFEMPNAWDEIRDTLGHEMIHYWLDHLGRPCGHTPEFNRKLKSCGFQRYSRLVPRQMRFIYTCPACNIKYYRRRRGQWSCGPCSGKRFNPLFKLVEVKQEQQGAPHK